MLYLYRFARLPPVLGDGIYAGLSLEAGNMWSSSKEVDSSDLLYSAAITLGLDSFLGPVYLAHGYNDHSGREWYLFVGRTF